MSLRIKSFFTAALFAVGFASTSALSQDTGFYAGLSIGQSKAKDACDPNTGLGGPGISCDDKDTALSIFGGYQINKNFGVELGYVNLGEATASAAGATASVEAKGFELLAVGTYPINQQFSVYGKLGFFRWDDDASVTGFPSFSETGTDLTYAIGGKYNFTKNIAATLQWQRYNDVGDPIITVKRDVDVLGVGVVFRF